MDVVNAEGDGAYKGLADEVGGVFAAVDDIDAAHEHASAEEAKDSQADGRGTGAFFANDVPQAGHDAGGNECEGIEGDVFDGGRGGG